MGDENFMSERMFIRTLEKAIGQLGCLMEWVDVCQGKECSNAVPDEKLLCPFEGNVRGYNNFCLSNEVSAAPSYLVSNLNQTRLAEWSDMSVFDFLICNIDRYYG